MLDHSLPVMRLYHQAKELLWDPRSVDISQDARDWQGFTERERDVILRLTTLFLGGEEAVAADLAPLLIAVSREERREEALFVTTQLFEEAKHVELFDRWLAAVAPTARREQFELPGYTQLFSHDLPDALDRLLTDSTAEAQLLAVATYHMTVEGVLAETGYEVGSRAFATRGVLPGLVSGLQFIQRDEARHIAYGISVLQRLLEANPALWPAFERRMDELLGLALSVIEEAFAPYGDQVPFDLSVEAFVDYATDQWGKRLAAISRVRPAPAAASAAASAPLAWSAAWVAAVADAINAHPGYARAAAEWTAPLGLVVTGLPDGERVVWLDLYRGQCRAARILDAPRGAIAPHVIRGDATTWQRILTRQLDPISALVQRKLRVDGALSPLLRQIGAARALVDATASVAAQFATS